MAMPIVDNQTIVTALAALKYYISGAVEAAPRRLRYWDIYIPPQGNISINIRVGRIPTVDYKIIIWAADKPRPRDYWIDVDDPSTKAMERLQALGGFAVAYALDAARYAIPGLLQEILASPPLNRGTRAGLFYFQDEYVRDNAGRLPGVGGDA